MVILFLSFSIGFLSFCDPILFLSLCRWIPLARFDGPYRTHIFYRPLPSLLQNVHHTRHTCCFKSFEGFNLVSIPPTRKDQSGRLRSRREEGAEAWLDEGEVGPQPQLRPPGRQAQDCRRQGT